MMMKGAVWLTNERKREGFWEEEGGNMHTVADDDEDDDDDIKSASQSCLRER